jgi:hypothetical protein
LNSFESFITLAEPSSCKSSKILSLRWLASMLISLNLD